MQRSAQNTVPKKVKSNYKGKNTRNRNIRKKKGGKKRKNDIKTENLTTIIFGIKAKKLSGYRQEKRKRTKAYSQALHTQIHIKDTIRNTRQLEKQRLQSGRANNCTCHSDMLELKVCHYGQR